MSTISEENNSNYSIDNRELFLDRTHAAMSRSYTIQPKQIT